MEEIIHLADQFIHKGHLSPVARLEAHLGKTKRDISWVISVIACCFVMNYISKLLRWDLTLSQREGVVEIFVIIISKMLNLVVDYQLIIQCLQLLFNTFLIRCSVVYEFLISYVQIHTILKLFQSFSGPRVVKTF